MSDRQSQHLGSFLTVRQAADVLGVSPSTLRNWDRSGKLKAARHPINGYRLYRESDLQDILESIDTPTSKARGRH